MQLNKTILILVTSSLLGSTDLCTQDTTPKSIISDYGMAMALDEPSIDQLDSVLQLSYRYLFRNQDTCLLVAQRGVEWAKELYPNQRVHGDALLQLGDAHRVRAELDKSIKLYIEGRTIYMEIPIEGKAANADTKLGATYKEQGEYEKAIDYHLSAMSIWEGEKDTSNVFKPYINISEVFYLLGRKDKALEYNSKALKIAEIKNYTGVKMVAMSNQGTLQKELAMEYASKTDTLPILKDSADYYFDQALMSYNYSLDIASNGNNKRRESAFLNEKADLLMEMGDYEQATQLGVEANQLAKELGSKYRTMESLLILTKANRLTNRYNKAISFGETAIKEIEDSSTDHLRSSINYELYLTHKIVGNNKKALDNLEDYKAYQDKANEIEQNKIVSDIEGKYQNVKTQEQILIQQNDILQLENTNSKITSQRNYIMGGTFAIALLSFFGIRLNKAEKEKNDKKAFADALIYAQEEERKRIARDLHDGVGQSLLLIRSQIERANSTAQENQQLITDTLAEVRSISQDLHPFQLDKFGLGAALEETLHKVEQSHDLFITREIDEIIKGVLTESQEINLYRTIQEAINNVIKHAEATAMKLSLKLGKDELKVIIQDNGKGFDHELALVKMKSLGLKTMNERIQNISGNFKISNGEQNGTDITITIPVKK